MSPEQAAAGEYNLALSTAVNRSAALAAELALAQDRIASLTKENEALKAPDVPRGALEAPQP